MPLDEEDGLAPMEEELDPGTDIVHHVPVDAMHPNLVLHLGTQLEVNPNRGAPQQTVMHLETQGGSIQAGEHISRVPR